MAAALGTEPENEDQEKTDEGQRCWPTGVVLAFPVDLKLMQARRAYHAELSRVDRLQYEGKRPRFNAKIKAAYFEARLEGCFG